MNIFSILIPFTQVLHVYPSPTHSLTKISSITDAFNSLVKSKNEKIMFHGCHCLSFTVPQGGIPVDERDHACMGWKASRSCVALKNGPCDGVSDRAYEWNGEGCDGLSACQRTICEIDQYYSNKIHNFDTDLVFIPSDEIGDQCKYGYVRPRFVDVYNRKTAFQNDRNQFFQKPEVRIKGAFMDDSGTKSDVSVTGTDLDIDEQELIDNGFTIEVTKNVANDMQKEQDLPVIGRTPLRTFKVEDKFKEWQENEKKFRKFTHHQKSLRDDHLLEIINPALQEPTFEKVSKNPVRDSCCNIEGHVWRKYNSEIEKCEDGLVSPLVSYVN